VRISASDATRVVTVLGLASSLLVMGREADWTGEGALVGLAVFAAWVALPYLLLLLLGWKVKAGLPVLAVVSVLLSGFGTAAYVRSFQEKHLTSTSGLVFLSVPFMQLLLGGGVMGVTWVGLWLWRRLRG
jgi:hypothetical protein